MDANSSKPRDDRLPERDHGAEPVRTFNCVSSALTSGHQLSILSCEIAAAGGILLPREAELTHPIKCTGIVLLEADAQNLAFTARDLPWSLQVDMDTIEVSNLNRQFLFRKRHVGKSKAETAAEAIRSFCPDAKIRTLQQNVKDSLFDLAFMKTFDIVLNGLDNDEARRHVNRLCLAAEVPLIESGTTGYKGQVCMLVSVAVPLLPVRPTLAQTVAHTAGNASMPLTVDMSPSTNAIERR